MRPLIFPELPGGPGYPLLEVGVLRRRQRAPQPVVVYRGVVARPVFTANMSRRIYPSSHEIRHLNCYPLRVRVRQISGLYEGLDCPSDWFRGVAEEGATPTNQ